MKGEGTSASREHDLATSTQVVLTTPKNCMQMLEMKVFKMVS